jgi:acetyltransferase-like isoleucine patch superfamily enzyme
MKRKLGNYLQNYPAIKAFILWMIQSKYQAHPRIWVKIFLNPFLHSKGKGNIIRRRTRMDIFPYKLFKIGNYSIIEDFATVNNGVGEVIIGNNSRIGIGNTIIGPVTIGHNVILAQNVVISGLNHGYRDITLPPNDQPVSTDSIKIEDDCWIGANVVITSGVTIGKHVVVGAGSVVTKDIPAFSVVVGNPAKIIKQYSFELKRWESVSS